MKQTYSHLSIIHIAVVINFVIENCNANSYKSKFVICILQPKNYLNLYDDKS